MAYTPKPWEYFKLEFDPTPSDLYPHGYWSASSDLGYYSSGPTVEATLAALLVELSKGYLKLHNAK